MPTAPRRFTLLDAMIGVSAVALAMAATRWKYVGYAWFWNLDREGWTPGATARRLVTAAAFALPTLFAATLALGLARLTPPRPPLRRIALQPGAAACGMVSLAVAIEGVDYFVRQAAHSLRMGHTRANFGRSVASQGFLDLLTTHVLIRSAYAASYAILTTWFVLALSRRGRPDPGWIDRTGRALGVAWIATAFLFWLARNVLGGGIPGSLGTPY